MLAKCPTCQTVFRITGKALRAARGYVRCGHCNLQFDAIHQLLDEDELETVADQESPHTLQSPSELPQENYPRSLSKPEPFSHEEIVMEGNRIEISGLYRELDADDDIMTITGTFTAFEEFNEAYSNWDISEEDLHATQESIEETLELPNETELEVPLPQKAPTDQSASEINITQLHTRTTQLESSAANETATDTAKESISIPSVNTPRRWPWTTASILLILILLTQGLHHYRLSLAKNLLLGPQIQSLYEALGHPLPRFADITRYTSTLTGMVSDPQSPGTLSLQAVIANQATDAQPYPWISIRLENRFGTPVGARIFKPEEYLAKAAKNQIMAAGVSESVRLAIVDPGQDAVGVKLDTCLPLSTGLRCSHEGQQ